MSDKNRLRNVVPLDVIEIKAIKDDGEFEALGAVTENIDRVNDRISKGAFKKTLRENKKFPLLWQHDWYEPIGSFSAKENDDGLLIKGNLNLEMVNGVPKVPNAVKAHALLGRGDINGFSIGYDVIKSGFEKVKDKTIRVISELKLWEVSVVTFPANPKAVLLDIKSMNDFWNILEERKEDKEFRNKLFSLFGFEPSELDTLIKPSDTDTKNDEEPDSDRWLDLINSLNTEVK